MKGLVTNVQLVSELSLQFVHTLFKRSELQQN